jgi:hypothetical protein
LHPAAHDINIAAMSIQKPKALSTLEIQSIFRKVRELMPMLVALGKDLERAIYDANQTTDDAYLKRNVFRCFSAWVEGNLALFRKAILLLRDSINATFSEREIALLSNDRRGSFKDNFKLIFDGFARLAGGGFRVEPDDRAYQDFLSSITVRDCLMHPKKVSDLDITPEQIRVAASGFKWYETKTMEMMILMGRRFAASYPTLLTQEERDLFGLTSKDPTH